jgi:hypothetical protein
MGNKEDSSDDCPICGHATAIHAPMVITGKKETVVTILCNKCDNGICVV